MLRMVLAVFLRRVLLAGASSLRLGVGCLFGGGLIDVMHAVPLNFMGCTVFSLPSPSALVMTIELGARSVNTDFSQKCEHRL